MERYFLLPGIDRSRHLAPPRALARPPGLAHNDDGPLSNFVSTSERVSEH